MIRILVLVIVMAGAAAMAAGQDAAARVIDAKRYHLGVAGLPEWNAFAGSAPDGPKLEIAFVAEPNARECTLFIRQRDVKTTWNVLLNGRRLGALEPLTQALILALPVPPGTLKAGENHLSIMRPPSPMLDDIMVGEISLDPRSRDEALGESAMAVDVIDAETRRPLPCRLTLVDPEGSLAPWRASAGQSLAMRTGVVYTGDGTARVTARSGDYILYASRGFEYSVASQRLTLGKDEEESKRVSLSIRREVPTPGLIACDSHIHTLTFSGHGDATIDERMTTIAGEGIELAVATDHNHHTDYTEATARAGLSSQFRSVVGNEVTTSVGHFNAFPVRADGTLPNARLTDWTQLLHNIRTVTGAKVITLNHPRDVHAAFTPFSADHFNATTGEIKGNPKFDCDAIEVVTSAALQSDIMLLYRDWFALLNHGFRVAAIGASDTHHVSQFILGQARTYAASRATDPANLDIDEVCASYRAGRLLVSMGLLTQITVDDRFMVGDLATGLGEKLQVTVEVFGPSWTEADRVELFANGIKLREESIAATTRPLKAHVTWTLPRPKHDVHLVAIATGPGITAPYWEIPPPYQPTSKALTPRVIGSTNPIWIDGDGDGKFTSARAYAVELVKQHGGDAAGLRAALVSYDAAVATQASDVIRGTGPAQ